MIPRGVTPQVGTGNYQVDQELESLPDRVADALFAWRMATLEREKIDALLYLQFKGGEEKRTAEEIKSMVRSDGEHYQAVIAEIKAEVLHTRLLEKLLSVKKQASLRTAF